MLYNCSEVNLSFFSMYAEIIFLLVYYWYGATAVAELTLPLPAEHLTNICTHNRWLLFMYNWDSFQFNSILLLQTIILQ